jgi:hypothetical protein
MRLPRFTKYCRKTRVQTGGANSSGITKLALTLRACWRKIQSGNPRLPSTRNSLPRKAAGAKKQKRALPIFGWSISFGQIDAKSIVAENVGLLSQNNGRIDLLKI